MNNKFFSSNEIYARLSANHPHKMSEIERYTVMRWCAEVQTELLKDPSGLERMVVELGKPHNLMVRIPMAVSKIERVYSRSSGRVIGYNTNGEYIFVSQYDRDTEVMMDCYTFPIDDEGFPMVKIGYEQACEAYCVYKMYHEDFLEGKMNGQQWGDICQTKDWEIGAALRAWDEVDDTFVKEVQNAMVNVGYKKIVRHGSR